MPIIKDLRKKLGISQEAFARAIGKSSGSVRSYEDGRKLPPDVMGKMLSLASKAGFTDLFGEIEHLAAEWYDQPVVEQAAAQEEAQPGGRLSSEQRAKLHALVDFVLDNANLSTAQSFYETVRTYAFATRMRIDPFLEIPPELED